MNITKIYHFSSSTKYRNKTNIYLYIYSPTNTINIDVQKGHIFTPVIPVFPFPIPKLLPLIWKLNSMSIVLLFCYGQKPRHTLSPHIIFLLIRALELDNAPQYSFQSEISPILAAHEQVASRPGRNIFDHLQHHICKFKKQKRGI